MGADDERRRDDLYTTTQVPLKDIPGTLLKMLI